MGWTDRDRTGFAVVAMLALLLQVAIPQGFMVSNVGAAPALVICTGHGPLIAPADDHGRPGKAPKQAGVCAFAGHGGTPTAPVAAAFIPVRFEHAAQLAPAPRSAAPGQGLAAPPPPSHAPPLSVV